MTIPKDVNTKNKTAQCPWCNTNLFDKDIIEYSIGKTTTLIWYGEFAHDGSSEYTPYDSYILCNECKRPIDVTSSELTAHYERDEPLKKLEKRL